jgi:hypothetical protein
MFKATFKSAGDAKAYRDSVTDRLAMQTCAP